MTHSEPYPYQPGDPEAHLSTQERNQNSLSASGGYGASGSSGNFSDWLRSLPSSQSLQPLTKGNLAGVPPELRENLIPAMWMAFAPYGQSLINQGALAKMRGATAGIAGGRHAFERSLLSSYQAAGLDPLFAKTQFAETRTLPGQQIAAARGGIEAERQEESFNMAVALQNALATSYAADRGMGLEAYMASRARKTARKTGKQSSLSSLGGGVAMGLGTYLGGIYGGGGEGGSGDSGSGG